jgi:hypothetical protein
MSTFSGVDTPDGMGLGESPQTGFVVSSAVVTSASKVSAEVRYQQMEISTVGEFVMGICLFIMNQ